MASENNPLNQKSQALDKAETQLKQEIDKRHDLERQVKELLDAKKESLSIIEELKNQLTVQKSKVSSLEKENKVLRKKLQKAQEGLPEKPEPAGQNTSGDNKFAARLKTLKSALPEETPGRNQSKSDKNEEVQPSAPQSPPDRNSEVDLERIMTARFGPRQFGKKK
jgi:chromosome segregation ATPase